jgi:hypothetical protein
MSKEEGLLGLNDGVDASACTHSLTHIVRVRNKYSRLPLSLPSIDHECQHPANGTNGTIEYFFELGLPL